MDRRSRARARSAPRSVPRVVVADVDGTLTDARRRLDPDAVALLGRLTDLHVPVILATGNVLPIALGLHRSLGIRGPIVAENGGLLYHPEGLRDRVWRLADPRPALRAYRHLRRSGLPVRRLFTDRWRESEVALDTSVPLARIQRALAGWPIRAESTGFAIHLMDPRAGKLIAVRRALALLRRDLSECLVLGDGDNDVDLLRAAGWSVSFPSASPRARAAARYVTRAPFVRGFIEGVKSSGVLGR